METHGTLKITAWFTASNDPTRRPRRVTLASIPTAQDNAEAAALAFVEANASTINKKHLEAEFIPHPQGIYIR